MKPDFTSVGLVDAGDNFDQGGLTGPVLAQQGMHFAGPQVKRNISQGMYPGKTFADMLHFEDGVVGHSYILRL
jgi:hypothetical protein